MSIIRPMGKIELPVTVQTYSEDVRDGIDAAVELLTNDGSIDNANPSYLLGMIDMLYSFGEWSVYYQTPQGTRDVYLRRATADEAKRALTDEITERLDKIIKQ